MLVRLEIGGYTATSQEGTNYDHALDSPVNGFSLVSVLRAARLVQVLDHLVLLQLRHRGGGGGAGQGTY